jgi:hypothetical protein
MLNKIKKKKKIKKRKGTVFQHNYQQQQQEQEHYYSGREGKGCVPGSVSSNNIMLQAIIRETRKGIRK